MYFATFAFILYNQGEGFKYSYRIFIFKSSCWELYTHLLVFFFNKLNFLITTYTIINSHKSIIWKPIFKKLSYLGFFSSQYNKWFKKK